MTTARETDRFSKQIGSLTESLIGLAVLVAVNVLFFQDDPGFLTVNPHPFLFLTILIASRYGTFDGFVTGFLSAVVYASYLFWGQDFISIRDTFEFNAMIPAYLFIILGLLLGEIREIANRDVLRMQDEVDVLRNRISELENDNGLLVEVKEELQQKVLSADDPLAEFYESARRLSTLKPDEAYPAVMDLVEKFTGAQKYALYLADPANDSSAGRPGAQSWRMRMQRGWSSDDEFPRILTDEHPAVGRSVAHGEVVAIRSAKESEKIDIIACAPMVDSNDNTVSGLIVIYRIPFVRLTQMTMSHLKTIAGWAGKTLADATRFDVAMDSRVDDEFTGTFNYRFMQDRLAQEAERVKRYGGLTTYLVVKVLDFETLAPRDRKDFLTSVGSLLKKQLRTVDVVGVHREPGIFGIILPATDRGKAMVVTSRIYEAFRRTFSGYGSRFAHLRLKMGISTTDQDVALNEARMAEEAEHLELGQ